MKKIFVVAIISLATLFLIACGGNKSSELVDNGKPVIDDTQVGAMRFSPPEKFEEVTHVEMISIAKDGSRTLVDKQITYWLAKSPDEYIKYVYGNTEDPYCSREDYGYAEEDFEDLETGEYDGHEFYIMNDRENENRFKLSAEDGYEIEYCNGDLEKLQNAASVVQFGDSVNTDIKGTTDLLEMVYDVETIFPVEACSISTYEDAEGKLKRKGVSWWNLNNNGPVEYQFVIHTQVRIDQSIEDILAERDDGDEVNLEESEVGGVPCMKEKLEVDGTSYDVAYYIPMGNNTYYLRCNPFWTESSELSEVMEKFNRLVESVSFK